jgi:3-hydroxyisobutyrate dehydrogenase-like beta-hydroxyacid dehydrogenase
LAEGLLLAQTLELDLASALQVLQGSAAYSRQMDTKGRKMIEGDFSPQAKLSQHLKDVRLMLQAAGAEGVRLALTETPFERLLEFAEEMGLGELDNSGNNTGVEQTSVLNHPRRVVKKPTNAMRNGNCQSKIIDNSELSL